jgi:hypothetical protein
MPVLGLVVEGDGDAEALPILLRRYLEQKGEYGVHWARAVNAKGRSKLLRDGALERFVRLASLFGPDGVLVVCDSDADPACTLGPAITERARAAVGIPVRCSLAVTTFENWIVASAETTGRPLDVTPTDYERTKAVTVIKEWRRPRSYIKPIDQPRLTAAIEPGVAASRCPSLARLFRCVDELLAEITA